MRYMKLLLLLSLVFAPLSAWAKTTDRIVAIVNDAVLTQSDLDQRFALMKRQMRNELTPEQTQSLYKHTLAGLIDEELYHQYGLEKGIDVFPYEIDTAVRNIEAVNKMKPGSFEEMTGKLISTARQQVSSNILWQKIVENKIRPKVSIPTDEIDLLIENLLAQSQTVERELSHILIGVDSKEDEAEANQKIKSVYQQLQSGEDFGVLAKTYSTDNNSAGNNGYLGWFATGEMSPDLEEALAELAVDSYTHPVHSPAGWHILKLESIRKTQSVSSQPIEEVNLWKAVIDVSSADKETLRKAKKAMKNIAESEDITEIIAEFGEKANVTGSGSLGWVKTADLNLETIKALKGFDPNTRSDVLMEGNKMVVYLVKGKRVRMSEQFEKYRERIRERLSDNRTELLARKFLRDLRRKAYIDIRL